MHFSPWLLIVGLTLQTTVDGTPTQEPEDIFQEADDVPSITLPKAYPDLTDFREYLDGYPRPRGNPDTYKPYGECLAGYWAYVDDKAVQPVSSEDAQAMLQMLQINPDNWESITVTRRMCLKDWNTRKTECLGDFPARTKDQTRAKRFDKFWNKVHDCMKRASHYSCPPGFWPTQSKKFIDICTKQHASLLPPSLVNPEPGSNSQPASNAGSPGTDPATESAPESRESEGESQPQRNDGNMAIQIVTDDVGMVAGTILGAGVALLSSMGFGPGDSRPLNLSQ